MEQDLRDLAVQYLEGLITAGEFRDRIVLRLVRRPLTTEEVVELANVLRGSKAHA